TARQADDLYELINERAGRSLVLTSNRSPVDWYPLFPNAVVAESLLDRLINTSHQVFMNGPSYRPNKRPRSVTSDKNKTTG
ncbi:ATP-binding protein, partial [Lentzea albidocapillata]